MYRFLNEEARRGPAARERPSALAVSRAWTAYLDRPEEEEGTRIYLHNRISEVFFWEDRPFPWIRERVGAHECHWVNGQTGDQFVEPAVATEVIERLRRRREERRQHEAEAELAALQEAPDEDDSDAESDASTASGGNQESLLDFACGLCRQADDEDFADQPAAAARIAALEQEIAELRSELARFRSGAS